MLHYTAMSGFEAARERLCDPAAQVSSHWLIGRDGTVAQLVDEDRRAWHAGIGTWGACRDVNSHSIGIELDNPGDAPFAAPLMTALERLLDAIMARHGLPPEAVIGHSDLAPDRKSDPGARFDWSRLARSGRSVWPRNAGREADGTVFREGLTRFGYDPTLDDQDLLRAFRMRFAPARDGDLTATETAMAADLGARWPLDGHWAQG